MEWGGHQKDQPSVTHRRPTDRTQGVCCRTYGSTTPMSIARLFRRSVNDAGTFPPAPLRVSGLLLVSILLLSASTTQRRLVRSCPHPVSKIQQSGRLSVDAHSPEEEEGVGAGQPVADAVTGMATSAPPSWPVAASISLRANSTARSARLKRAAAPRGTGGGRTIMSIVPIA